MESKKALEAGIKALEMYKKDLMKIRAAVLKKREKEIIKLETKIEIIEDLSEDELQDLYGYDAISKREYESRLKNLREYEENKDTFKDEATILKSYLALLNQDIWNMGTNIQLDREEL